MAATTLFDACFAALIGNEGGLSLEQSDPGNWTGGRVGVGRLLGTNWGISAAAYPMLDIATLTRAAAAAIYLQRYWGPIGAEHLPPPLALLAFDAAVNLGVAGAAKLLQLAIGAEEDGLVGPATLAAAARSIGAVGLNAVCAEFLARRLMFTVALPTWRTFGLGWARRLCRLPFQAQAIPTAA
ncbi:MAG TPA: glycosyl hydrolase 108 family protein [Acetobacteraceae bacterium]|nr:glycosyl hydrolase 108 family protein [Acetobacteraceae bacterium]